MKRQGYKTICIALCLAALMLFAAGCKSEEQIQQQQMLAAPQEDPAVYVDLRSTITVNGTGKVILTPDTATVYFTVNNQGEEAEAVQQENAQATQAVMDAILALGILQEDIETSSVDLYEDYDYSKEPATLVGYNASCQLTVIVRDTDLTGELITAAVAAGASEVRGPEYSISDSSDAYLQALEAAIADAGEKAAALAAGAEVELVSLPISMEEISTNRNISAAVLREEAAMDTASSADAAVDAPISISDMEVTAQVTAVYEIR